MTLEGELARRTGRIVSAYRQVGVSACRRVGERNLDEQHVTISVLE
jgi:hypothetical protein